MLVEMVKLWLCECQIQVYSVFESFEDNAAWESHPALAWKTAQSRNLALFWLEIPIQIFPTLRRGRGGWGGLGQIWVWLLCGADCRLAPTRKWPAAFITALISGCTVVLCKLMSWLMAKKYSLLAIFRAEGQYKHPLICYIISQWWTIKFQL